MARNWAKDRIAVVVGLLSLLAVASLEAAPTLKVGNASGAAGTVVDLPINFDPGKATIVSIEFDLTLPPGLSTGTVTAAETLNSAGKSIGTSFIGQRWRFLIFGLNQSAIGSNKILTAQVKIAPGTPAGKLKIPVSNVSYSDAAGRVVVAGKSVGCTVAVSPPHNP